MKITRKLDYGLRALLYLSSQPVSRPVILREISKKTKIPRQFLAKILLNLMKEGLVRSHRGSQGGFLLAKPAREISFLDVFEAINGPLAINRCLSDDYRCECEGSCGIKQVWSKAQRNLTDILVNTTLADLSQQA